AAFLYWLPVYGAAKSLVKRKFAVSGFSRAHRAASLDAARRVVVSMARKRCKDGSVRGSGMGFNPIHVIFGLKLRQARLEKGLSVTELAERSQLSPSYVTEIEKGRKYPKADKIMRLAQALGYDYDELVSRRLEPPLSFLESSLTSQLLRQFPLQLFGVDPATVVEVLTRSPAEMSALLQALQDVARGYNIREEHLYRAALRSYQESHSNYFEDLEEQAAR